MSTILDAYELYMHVTSNKSQNTVISYRTQLQVFLMIYKMGSPYPLYRPGRSDRDCTTQRGKMLFIPEQNAGLVNLFKEKAINSCKVRIALADPTCDAVRWRDEEEQLGGTLPGRIKNCLYHFRSIRSLPGIEIRYHSTILYNSLFRADDEMFVTPHLYGLHGSKAPLFHLRRLGSDSVFVNFALHFEQVWKTTKPIE